MSPPKIQLPFKIARIIEKEQYKQVVHTPSHKIRLALRLTVFFIHTLSDEYAKNPEVRKNTGTANCDNRHMTSPQIPGNFTWINTTQIQPIPFKQSKQ